MGTLLVSRVDQPTLSQVTVRNLVRCSRAGAMIRLVFESLPSRDWTHLLH